MLLIYKSLFFIIYINSRNSVKLPPNQSLSFHKAGYQIVTKYATKLTVLMTDLGKNISFTLFSKKTIKDYAFYRT